MGIDYKEIRKRLYNYKKIKAEKIELQIRYEELKDNIGIKSIECGSEGKSYGISKTTEKQALEVIEAKEKLHEFIRIKGLEILRIENSLKGLKEKEKELIKLKYFDKRRNEDLPYLLDRSKRTCERLEAKALKQIYEILNI